MKLALVLILKQGQYQTVAEALQAAVVSLLDDEEMKYNINFFYWAAFLPHGCAIVKLDDALLDQIHDGLESLVQNDAAADEGDQGTAIETTMLTMTRKAYHHLEYLEQTLSREWCEKWVRDERLVPISLLFRFLLFCLVLSTASGDGNNTGI